MIRVILSILGAYLLGSIPTAYLAGKWGKGIDLREHGSGNLGFTNAWRVLGAKWSIPVLVVDVLKGWLSIQLARYTLPGSEWLAVVCGLAAVSGHDWSIFLGFRGGGKGVACSAGVFLALSPIAFLAALTAFLVMISATRYMSVGSISGAVVLVAAGGIQRGLHTPSAPSTEVFLFMIAAAILVVVRHRSNLRRLLQGTEAKLGESRRETPR